MTQRKLQPQIDPDKIAQAVEDWLQSEQTRRGLFRMTWKVMQFWIAAKLGSILLSSDAQAWWKPLEIKVLRSLSFDQIETEWLDAIRNNRNITFRFIGLWGYDEIVIHHEWSKRRIFSLMYNNDWSFSHDPSAFEQTEDVFAKLFNLIKWTHTPVWEVIHYFNRTKE